MMEQQSVKFSGILAFCSVFLFSLTASVISYAQLIRLDLRETTLAKVIDSIKVQSPGINFSYSPEDLQKVPVQKIFFKNSSLQEALQVLQQQFGLESYTADRTISLRYNRQPAPKPRASGGSLRGRVVDFETLEPLPGASVAIVETGRSMVTDEKGYFRIDRLDPGNYRLQVSYSGYQVNTTGSLAVISNRETVQDVKMQVASELSTVVVRSNKSRIKSVTYSTELQLINEIRNARSVVSGISNEQIARTADRNAAEIVGRISGITVTDDRFIVVRGMNQRYNLTYLNGNVAPATELYSRAFAYDLLPSPIIDKILVYKSPSPDLLGDFAGGVVKVFTKNAKPVRHFDIGFQMGYRQGSTNETINSYTGRKRDWLGFDDGGRKLPEAITKLNGARIPQSDQERIINAFNNKLHYNRQQSSPDLQAFLNYFDNFDIGHIRVNTLTSLTFSKETRFFNIDRQTGNTYDNHLLSLQEFNQFGHDDRTTEIAKLNLLQNFTIKINPKNILHFNNFLLNDGRKITSVYTFRQNQDSASMAINTQRNRRIFLGFQQRSLYAGNLDGEHTLSPLGDVLRWNLGYTYSKQDQPDQRVSNFRSVEPGSGFTGRYDLYPVSNATMIAGGSNIGGANDLALGMISRLFVTNREQIYNATADYTHKISSVVTLKAGFYQLFRYRTVNRHFLRVNRAGLNGNEVNFGTDNGAANAAGFGKNNPELLLYNEDDLQQVWGVKYFRNDRTGLALFDATSPADQYTASEENSSGYLMSEWQSVDKKWNVSGGLRLEYDRQKVSGAYSFEGLIVPILVDQPKTAWLPSINSSFSPDAHTTIRAGYGKTINRPEFREITPANDFDFSESQLIHGNPGVVSADIDNYDLRLEWYPANKKAEAVSAGVFYKQLIRPIERIRKEISGGADVTSFTEISFSNASRATVLGVEAEVRKHLSFIPGNFFKKLSFVGNAAFIHSEVSADSSYYTGHAIKGRQLQGQVPYVVNSGIFYENSASGTKVGLIYSINGPSIYAASSRSANDTTSFDYNRIRPSLLELPRQLLDFSFTQRIIKSLQLKVNIQNLLDQSYRLAEDQNGNSRYDKEYRPSGSSYYRGDDLFSSYHTGRYYTATITYAF